MAQVFRGLDPKHCWMYLKLKPKKCRMFQTEVEYHGHIVSEIGIQTDPKKVSAVAEWPTPQTVMDVRSCLGFASYYRKLIPDFSTTAYPLIKFTRQDKDFLWDVEQQRAFEELQQCLISAPILSYPKDEGLYIVDTDASNVGLGGVRSQV